MIEIIVDCNNDLLSTSDDNKVLGEMKVVHPVGLCKILENLFDSISDYKPNVVLYVRLTKIDEDTRTTIGEW